MKRFIAIAVGAFAAAMLSAGMANAAATATSAVPITGQGSLYKEVKKPVNVSFTANINPGPGDTTLTPLMETKFFLPSDLAFVPDPNMPVCTALNSGTANVPPATAVSLCPNSVIGDGTASINLAGFVASLITDPKITIFNGGTDANGGGILSIHAYSASTNAGILMTGAIKNGVLDVQIPRITADSATSKFTLSIPGTQGQTKSYAQATCSTGTYASNADFTLANRDGGGVVSNKQVLTTAQTSVPCVGLAGSAKINKVTVKGPSKISVGKPATYKVKMTNNGTATAKSVKIKVSGKGIAANASGGKIAPGATKTVKVKIKPKKRGKIKASFKVSTSTGSGKTVKKTITVK